MYKRETTQGSDRKAVSESWHPKWGLRVGIVLLMALPQSDLRQAFSQENTEAVELVAASSGLTVRFGDPVLIPLAIANQGKVPQVVPRLSDHLPPLSITIVSERGRVHISLVEGIGCGQARSLGIHEMEYTVIPINLWSPEFFRGEKEFSKLSKASIELRFQPTTYEGGKTSLVFKHRFDLTIKGSAFLASSSPVLRDAISSIPPPAGKPVYTSNILASGHGSPFVRGSTPLCWLNYESSETADWYLRQSEVVKKCFEILDHDSRAFRLLEASLLLAEVKGSELRADKRIDSFVAKYTQLLKQCDPVEQHYLSFLVKNIPVFQRNPLGQPMTWKHFQRLRQNLVSEVPHLAPYVYSEGFSVLSKCNCSATISSPL